jgi:transaldolase
LRDALARGISGAEDLFWDLASRDIREAADVLRPVYDATDGVDGFVSLELPPRLSRDPRGSVELATQLFARLDRPNAMIKVPGTPESVDAIEELIYRGVNVNVTLLFSLPQWRAAWYAYLRGLERRATEYLDLRVASVASYFVSRIDGKANARLPGELHNRLGLASAQQAYAAYQRMLGSGRWQRLAAGGARPQQLLWASTAPKDAALPETFYLGSLAAPGTVVTIPEPTLLAFSRYGTVQATLPGDAGEAQIWIDRAAAHGVRLYPLGEELQNEGDAAFADAFDRLLSCIRTKAAALQPGEPRGPRRPLRVA